MIIYYKVLQKELGIRMYKPFFENFEVTETNFIKKARVLLLDKIRKNIPEPYATYIIARVKRVHEINHMNLSVLGSVYDDRCRKIKYLIGNCDFEDKSLAIAHGETVFGENFMDDNKSKFNRRILYYFREKDEITEKEYNELKQEYNELIKINHFKIEKENKPSTPKR